MTTEPRPIGPADLLALVLIAVAMVAWAVLRLLLLPALALLLALAGWRPAAPAPLPTAPPTLPPAGAVALESLTVAELRRLARAAGLPALARRGRRAELLLALSAV
jgi:hypothetical protein